MILKNEIERRENIKDDEATILGTEIKNRRLSMSLTLAALAESTCSTSYLCKIEKAQINANDKRLEEICRRVGMTKVQYNDLINLRKALELVCNYYFEKNNSGIQRLKKSLSDFTNYRSNIINYVIALFEGNELLIERYSKAILGIIKEVSDLDLLVFMTFYAIELMRKNKVVEASDNIKAILDKNTDITYLKIIQLECLFDCAYKSCSPFIYKYYDMLKDLYYENAMYQRNQFLNYKIAIHELCNQRIQTFNSYFAKVKDLNYRINLIFINHIISAEFNKAKKCNPEKLSTVFKMVYYFYFDQQEFKLKYKAIDKNKLEVRERILIDYLYAKINKNRLTYLLNEGLDFAIDNNDGFMMNYLLDELSGLLQNNGSYLCFFEFYNKIIAKKRVICQI